MSNFEFPLGYEKRFNPNLFDFHWNEDYTRFNAVPLRLSEFHPLNRGNPAEATTYHASQLEALRNARADLKEMEAI